MSEKRYLESSGILEYDNGTTLEFTDMYCQKTDDKIFFGFLIKPDQIGNLAFTTEDYGAIRATNGKVIFRIKNMKPLGACYDCLDNHICFEYEIDEIATITNKENNHD